MGVSKILSGGGPPDPHCSYQIEIVPSLNPPQLSVADPVGLRKGVHRSIDLCETPSDKGIDMGGGFPLSLVGIWGASPIKISEK